MSRFWIVIAICALIGMIGFGSAESLEGNKLVNESMEVKASACLNETWSYFEQIEKHGLGARRINDSFKEATKVYDAQVVLKQANKSGDFSMVLGYCDEMAGVYKNAIAAYDELSAFMKFYQSSRETWMNTSLIDSVLSEIDMEMKNERYENVRPLIDKSYGLIIDIKSKHTTLNVFYSATATGFNVFIKKYGKSIAYTLIALFVLLLVYRAKISKLIIQRKINRLELRKRTIKELIMKTQKEYFGNGNISEGTYQIKTKKFSEMIRDIERQIPLLREELEKLNKRRRL